MAYIIEDCLDMTVLHMEYCVELEAQWARDRPPGSKGINELLTL